MEELIEAPNEALEPDEPVIEDDLGDAVALTPNGA